MVDELSYLRIIPKHLCDPLVDLSFSSCLCVGNCPHIDSPTIWCSIRHSMHVLTVERKHFTSCQIHSEIRLSSLTSRADVPIAGAQVNTHGPCICIGRVTMGLDISALGNQARLSLHPMLVAQINNELPKFIVEYSRHEWLAFVGGCVKGSLIWHPCAHTTGRIRTDILYEHWSDLVLQDGDQPLLNFCAEQLALDKSCFWRHLLHGLFLLWFDGFLNGCLNLLDLRCIHAHLLGAFDRAVSPAL